MAAGDPQGTISGMATQPVATAASFNPVLTTLFAALSTAELVETLDATPALTVFAPTDCAFETLDPTALDNAMADPAGIVPHG